jgi:uncharacterized protein YukE
MDIGQVEDLAARLDGNARTLTAIAAVLGGLVAELQRIWLGPAFGAFASDFDASHRPALLAAAQTLTDLHARLVANIDQQLAASSAATEGGGSAAALAGAIGGGLLGAAALRDVGRGWNLLNTASGVEGLVVQDPIEVIKDLAGGDHTMLELRDTKVLSWLPDTDEAKSIDEFLAHTHVYSVTDTLAGVGTALGVAGMAIDMGQAGRDVYDGNYAAAGGQVVNTASTGLMTKGGVYWLAGFDLEVAKADYDEITMGGPLPSLTWSNFKNEYVPDFTTQLPKEAWAEKGDLFKLLMGDG